MAACLKGFGIAAELTEEFIDLAPRSERSGRIWGTHKKGCSLTGSLGEFVRNHASVQRGTVILKPVSLTVVADRRHLAEHQADKAT